MKPWMRDVLGATGAACLIGAVGMIELVAGIAVAGGLLIAVALLAGESPHGPG